MRIWWSIGLPGPFRIGGPVGRRRYRRGTEPVSILSVVTGAIVVFAFLASFLMLPFVLIKVGFQALGWWFALELAAMGMAALGVYRFYAWLDRRAIRLGR